MKKRVLASLLFFMLILFSFSAIADENSDKAYSCLKGKVEGKCSSLTLEEQAFSLLALASESGIQSNCKSALADNSKSQECWPKSACKLRDTAISTLAFQHINSNTKKPEDWLISQNKTPSELSFYLEIDAKEPSACKIYLDNSSSTSATVTQLDDKRLSLSSSSCFSLANSNYWLQISPSCQNRAIKVSCDKDFATAILYKLSSSDIWHISSRTESSSAGGTTENKINALCLKQNNECNYEGTLWGALALQKNHDISSYLPYLVSLAGKNEKYNPYAFLYILTGSDEYLALLREKQNPAGFSDFSSGYGRYYDTALSLLALNELSDESDRITSWLYSVQDSGGCWQNSIRDTAFILYSGFRKSPSITPSLDYCEDYGKFCSSRTECLDINGEILDNFVCRQDSLKVCCSKQVEEKTCAEKSGIKCSSKEECTGNLVSSSDSGRCCVSGSCIEQEVSGCESSGYLCKYSCSDDEEIKYGTGLNCDSETICCGLKEKSSSYLWVWILIILIILLVLGILFRKRLRVFLFKFRNRGKSSSVSQTRPPFPPSQPPRLMPRAMYPPPRVSSQPARKPKARADDELEETLNKLKNMSK